MMAGRRSPASSLVLVPPLLCAACLAAGSGGRDAGTAPEVPDGIASDPGSGDPGVGEDVGIADVTGTDVLPDIPPDIAPGDDGARDLRCADGFVFIDFPCDRPFRCDDERTFRRLHSVGCAEAGFDPECCSGGGCDASEPLACPDGTWCVEEGYGHRGDSPCRPIDCGRAGDPPCPDGTYCETPRGQCGTAGVCIRSDCTEGIRYTDVPWTSDHPWQCGCDGLPYPDACFRQAAGAALDSDGPCCDPARLAIPPDNPEHFNKWVACIRPDVAWTQPPPAAETVLRWARHYALAEPLGCLPGETGYTRDLDIHVGGAPEPGTWKGLCELASLPFVRTVFGIAAFACEGVPCWEGLSCREAPYCPSPCGCCTCTDGDRACGNDLMGQNHHYGIVTCQGGCWSDPEWCAVPGTECVASPGGPECRPTCAAIASAHAHLDGWGNCAVDADCLVRPGLCGGQGACHIAFVPGEYSDPAVEAELAGRWYALGCGVPGCDCGPVPAARCDFGSCRVETGAIPGG